MDKIFDDDIFGHILKTIDSCPSLTQIAVITDYLLQHKAKLSETQFKQISTMADKLTNLSMKKELARIKML